MPIHVLVADGQLLFADAVALALAQDTGIAVRPERPQAGAEAVAAVLAAEPDVAVLDYWLHEMEGPAVVRGVLAREPRTRIVHLAWFHTPHDVVASLGAGAVGFLPKDRPLADLATVIRRAHGGEDPVAADGLDVSLEQVRGRRRVFEATGQLLASLSGREAEVLRLAGFGLSQTDMARELGVSRITIESHVNKMLRKLGVHSQLEAVALARRHGVIP